MTAGTQPADGGRDGDAGAHAGSPPAAGVAVRHRALAIAAILFASIAAVVLIADPLSTSPPAQDTPAQEAVSLEPGAGPAGAAGAVPGPATWQRPALGADALAATVGVRLSQLALTGGGGLIDLRLLVVDAQLAEALHDPATPIAIVDEATGVVANSMLMGHSHSDKFQPGHVYYFVLENPGNVIQRDAKVSVLLGGAELDHVEVR